MAPEMRCNWLMKNFGNGHPLRDDTALNEELKFLWEERGPSGKSYDFYLSQISRSPVVRSHSIGRYFLPAWPGVHDPPTRPPVNASVVRAKVCCMASAIRRPLVQESIPTGNAAPVGLTSFAKLPFLPKTPCR
jgi:hypothetical protein